MNHDYVLFNTLPEIKCVCLIGGIAVHICAYISCNMVKQNGDFLLDFFFKNNLIVTINENLIHGFRGELIQGLFE